MDKNNPPLQPSVANAAPVQPSTPQVPISNPPPESNKVILWLVIGLVAIVVVVGGIYFFLSKQQANTAQTTNVERPIVQASPKPSDTVDALDKDLSALNVGTADADFSSVDQDLQQL